MFQTTLTLLFCLAVNTEAYKLKSGCSSYKLGNNYYTKHILKTISGIPADMSIQFKTGNIFFTLINKDMEMSIRSLSPKGELKHIRVPGVGQSTTVDNHNNIVYLASDNGLYIYEENGELNRPLVSRDEDIMYVAVTDEGKTIYIATWPQNRVFQITNNATKIRPYPDVIDGHNLVVDANDNKFYVASKTAYLLKADDTLSVKIQGLVKDKMISYFVSKSGSVYAMDEDSNMYEIDIENARAIIRGNLVLGGVNTFGMDDSDNVIVGVRGNLILFEKGFEFDPCIETTKRKRKNKKNKRKLKKSRKNKRHQQTNN